MTQHSQVSNSTPAWRSSGFRCTQTEALVGLASFLALFAILEQITKICPPPRLETSIANRVHKSWLFRQKLKLCAHLSATLQVGPGLVTHHMNAARELVAHKDRFSRQVVLVGPGADNSVDLASSSSEDLSVEEPLSLPPPVHQSQHGLAPACQTESSQNLPKKLHKGALKGLASSSGRQTRPSATCCWSR